MTCRELLEIEHPEKIDAEYQGGCCGCPGTYAYKNASYPSCTPDVSFCTNEKCIKCWDQPADEEAVERVMGIVNQLCEVGNVNPASVEELKQVIYKASGLPESLINRLETDETIKKAADTYVDMMKSAGPIILDSGDRTEFETGAVRDMRKGKGRCDLMPLDVVADYLCADDYGTDQLLQNICRFQDYGNISYLYSALHVFSENSKFDNEITMFLEAAIHFEDGANKYGENNWQKGIPVNCYIDSAVRHYLKYLRGDKDEPHDRAFVWNILCCIWTCKHHPELNNYAKK